jgi:hypothetical protein
MLAGSVQALERGIPGLPLVYSALRVSRIRLVKSASEQLLQLIIEAQMELSWVSGLWMLLLSVCRVGSQYAISFSICVCFSVRCDIC